MYSSIIKESPKKCITVCHLVLVFCLVVPFENFGKGIEPETDAALVPSPIDDVTVQFVGVLVEETGRAEVQHAIAAPDYKRFK